MVGVEQLQKPSDKGQGPAPKWSVSKALVRLAIWQVGAALVGACLLKLDPNEIDSSYLYSAIPQSLAGLFGMLAAVTAFASQASLTNYGVNPVTILLGNERLRATVVLYLGCIGFSLSLIPLKGHTILSTPFDECAVCALTGWLLGETASLAGELLSLSRPSELARQFLDRATIKDLLVTQHLSGAYAPQPDHILPAFHILYRTTTRNEIDEMTQIYRALALRVSTILEGAGDGDSCEAIKRLRDLHNFSLIVESSVTYMTVDLGVGNWLMRILGSISPRPRPLQELFKWGIHLLQTQSHLKSFVPTSVAFVGASLYKADPSTALELSEARANQLVELSKSALTWKGLEDEYSSELQSYIAALADLSSRTGGRRVANAK